MYCVADVLMPAVVAVHEPFQLSMSDWVVELP